MNCINAVVEVQRRVLADEGRDVDDAKELLASLRMYPEVYAEQAVHLDCAAGFLESLADNGLFGRFAGLDMATRLRDDNHT